MHFYHQCTPAALLFLEEDTFLILQRIHETLEIYETLGLGALLSVKVMSVRTAWQVAETSQPFLALTFHDSIQGFTQTQRAIFFSPRTSHGPTQKLNPGLEGKTYLWQSHAGKAE